MHRPIRPEGLREEDAYASPLANPCSWAFGTAVGGEDRYLRGRQVRAGGFQSKLDTPEKQFVQRGAVSSEFRSAGRARLSGGERRLGMLKRPC